MTITPEDIRSIEDYEAVRDDLRTRIIALKKHRRVFIGERMSMVFENRETMLWQIHEMMRTENIRDRAALAHECATYSQLLPRPSELSATLYIEIAQSEEIRPWLDKLLGVDEHTQMRIGDDVVEATFDPEQYSAERISAVHYLRFALDDRQRARFLDREVPARIEITHPNYEATAELTGETRRSLSEDLQ